MHSIRRLAAVLPLVLVLLLSACGGKSTLTAAPGACKGYNPVEPPLLQNYYYHGDETQVHFAIPANSTLVEVVDGMLTGQYYVLYPAPQGGGTVAVPETEAGGFRGDIVQIAVVDNTNVKPMLEWLIVNAFNNQVAVASEYNDAKGNEVSVGVYFGLNPCVDNLYRDK